MVGVKKKFPISRLYNGTGNSVQVPFNFRAVAFLSVFKPFSFCPKVSPSVLVNGPARMAQLNTLSH